MIEEAIKFRAWDELNKVMHYDVEFIRSGTNNGAWIIFKSDKQRLEDGKVFDNPYPVQQIKLMRGAGIEDKNGKEMYEGDIVRFKSGEQGKQLHDSIGIVKSRRGAFVIDSPNCFGASTLLLYHLNGRGEIWWVSPVPHADDLYCIAKDFEVVGNIYENPELVRELGLANSTNLS